MIDPERAQFVVLGGRSRSNDIRAGVLGDLGCGDAHATPGGMNEDRLTGLQSTHHDRQLPSSEVVHRDRRSFLSGHAWRSRKDLGLGNTNHVGVAAEAGQPEHFASDPAGVNSAANCVDAPSDLISWHDRNTWKVRIQTEPTENVGKIDAARLDANAHLARSRLRIGGLFDNKNLGRARFRNPDLPHG